jgi:tRNA (adenine58-N1)-methyltransferase non-catalytic subunit
MENNNIIRANDFVVIQYLDDKNSSIVKVDGEQKIGKSRVSLKEMIGEPYGTLFEINNRKLVKIAQGMSHNDVEMEDDNNLDNITENLSEFIEAAAKLVKPPQNEKGNNIIRGDNSYYIDSNTAQRLTDAEILQMRQSGMSGEQIIKMLMENSSTFATKTDFAQQKWIKRKEKKYIKKIRVLKCSPLTVCNSSLSRNRDKVCNLRSDSLAQVLGQSGVCAGSRVLVVESTSGLVVGSLAYRMRGEGRILALYGAQQPHFIIASNFNLSEKELDIIQVTKQQKTLYNYSTLY